MPGTLAQIPERHELELLVTEVLADAMPLALAPFCSVDEHSAAASGRQYRPRKDVSW